MNFAIGYAHFQLAGGTRAIWRLCIGFLILATVGLGFYARLGGGGAQAAAAASSMPALILLMFALVVLVNGRIGNALKLDNQLDMARSHRLMAVSAPAAILGYMLGPTLPLLCVCGLVVLYTAGGFIAGGHDLAALIAAVGIIVAFASTLVSLNVLAGTLGKGGGMGWIWGVFVGSFFATGGSVFALLPFTLALIVPFSGDVTVFRMRDLSVLSVGHIVGAGTHLLLFAIFFAAACRKWRRPDRPAMSSMLWLAIMGVIVGATLGSVHWYEAMKIGAWTGAYPTPRFTFPGTLTLLVLIAHAAFRSHERQAAAWRLRRNVNDPAADDEKPRLRSWMLLALLVGVIAPMGLLTPWYLTMDSYEAELRIARFVSSDFDLMRLAWPVTAVATLVALATAWVLMRGLSRMKAIRFVVWIYLLLWIIPFVIGLGLTLWASGDLDDGPSWPIVFAYPGLLYQAWSGDRTGLWAGVAWQAGVAITLAVAFWRVRDHAATPLERDAPAPLQTSPKVQ